MPFDQVMHKFKHGELHSGSKGGPKVKNRKQALAIMLSEKRKGEAGDTEYMPKNPKKKKEKGKVSTGPSDKFLKKFGLGNG